MTPAIIRMRSSVAAMLSAVEAMERARRAAK